ncbi:glycosyltransferase [Aureibaculum sp. 2210JD6-5]|uniref:glycosyltransferase family 2 protein n=1 Tax=Aureibaculum sp. 2210JD6-5 TaxID=3103957 RepID=UPI002AAE9DF5|nr:glycosyltransferase [Aureibaculum sp. 2210JD6-5]MDY7395868.1 glycosyltransferase [Aureibaculum sp. 2210JD6-5]
MILVSTIILTIYTLLILWLIIGFDKVKPFEKKVETPKNKFSIIIPFRNEENNLIELLNSLSLLNYPNDFFEIFMVDDDSEDNSVEVIGHFKTRRPNLPIQILKNQRKSGSPKKDAIETAIQKAKFDWIITTDADCVVPKNWLQTFDTFIINYQPKLIAAPVTYAIGNSFLEQFQLFDFLSLQAATIGGFGINKPFLCNGANLCYEKSAFVEVNGFEGNAQIASGDDIFLLEKMKNKFPEKVHFLKSKEVIVFTKPQPTFSSLISQRVRWAAKTSSLKGSLVKFIGIIVFLLNSLLVSALFLVLLGYFNLQFLLILFGIKLIIDFVLLMKSYKLFGHSFHFTKYFVSSLCYPFFSMFVVILSFKKGYQWKNRTFKK